MNTWRHLWNLGHGVLGGSALLVGTSLADAQIVTSKTSAATAQRHNVAVSPLRQQVKTVAILLQPNNAPAGAASTPSGSDITVRLPLYPGAVSQESGAGVAMIPTGSPYLKAGSATFMAQASPDAVEAWYVGAMTPEYTMNRGTAAGKTGVFPEITCTSRATPGLTVEVDFITPQSNPDGTEIDYWVTDYNPPARTPISVIPSDVTKLKVDYEPASKGASGGASKLRRTFTAQSVIRPLVHDINVLKVDTRDAPQGCSSLSGGATLDLVTKSGKTIRVQLGFQCNRVQVGNSPVLFDVQNRVWTDVSKAMGFKPYLTK